MPPPPPSRGGGTLFEAWVLMGSRQGCIGVGGWVGLVEVSGLKGRASRCCFRGCFSGGLSNSPPPPPRVGVRQLWVPGVSQNLWWVGLVIHSARLAPPPRYGIQMRVHDRRCSAQSRSAKQKSKRKALQ